MGPSDEPPSSGGRDATYTDSSYLKILQEQGFLGGFLFSSRCWGPWSLCWRPAGARRSPRRARRRRGADGLRRVPGALPHGRVHRATRARRWSGRCSASRPGTRSGVSRRANIGALAVGVILLAVGPLALTLARAADYRSSTTVSLDADNPSTAYLRAPVRFVAEPLDGGGRPARRGQAGRLVRRAGGPAGLRRPSRATAALTTFAVTARAADARTRRAELARGHGRAA